MGFVGLMVAVFAVVGVFPSMSSRITAGTSVASVGGEPIPIADFQRTLQREMEAYKAFGDQLPPFFISQIQERALQSMIQQKLLLLEARRMGIYLSDQEVMKTIEQQKYFQDETTKKFDVEKF